MDRNEPHAPSALTGQLTSLRSLLAHPGLLLAALGQGVVFALLVVLVAGVFNEVVKRSQLSGRVTGGRWAGLSRLVVAVQRWVGRRPVVAAVVVGGVTSLVLSGVDPHIGWDLVSARLVASNLLASLTGSVFCAWAAVRLLRWRRGLEVTIHAVPWGLLLALLGVAVSRMLAFEPGFLVGEMLLLTVASARSATAVVERARFVTSFGVALGAWVGADLTGPVGFGSALLHDAFVVTTTSVLCGLLIRLLPVPLLGGEFRREAPVSWGVSFTLTLAAFLVVVAPQATNWLFVGDALGRWLALTGVFLALVAAVYIWQMRSRRGPSAPARGERGPDGPDAWPDRAGPDRPGGPGGTGGRGGPGGLEPAPETVL